MSPLSAGPRQNQLASPYLPLPYPVDVCTMPLRCILHWIAPAYVSLSSWHLLCASEQTHCGRGSWGSALPPLREGPHLHQDLTAQRVLTRGGRLVLLEEERGKEEAGIGRAGGVHGPEGELGQEKRGEGCSHQQCQAQPSGRFLLTHLP